MTQKEKILKAIQLAQYMKNLANCLRYDAQDYDVKFPLQYAIEMERKADEFLNLK